jgi:hypothetical protein
VLATCETKQLALNDEIRLISELNTLSPNGYNMTRGGEGGELSDEAKQRYYVAVRSPEMCAKRSKLALDYFNDPERAKHHKESVSSQESRQKLSIALKSTNSLLEVKKRRSEAQIVAQNDPDVSKRKSISISIANQRDDVKKKRRAAMIDVHNRDSVREAKRLAKSRPVQQVLIETGEAIATYRSLNEASQLTCIHVSNISGCVCGTRKSAGGFLWRYAVLQTNINI